MALSFEQIEFEKKSVHLDFLSNFNPHYMQFLFKVGKYKRKSGWYFYAKDIWGRWRKITESKSALAIQHLIFKVKEKYKDYRPYFIIDDDFTPACFDELRDASWCGNDEMSKEYWRLRNEDSSENKI